MFKLTLKSFFNYNLYSTIIFTQLKYQKVLLNPFLLKKTFYKTINNSLIYTYLSSVFFPSLYFAPLLDIKRNNPLHVNPATL